MHNEYTFIDNIRGALGKLHENVRSGELFTELFPGSLKDKIDTTRESRSIEEQNQLVETLINRAAEINISVHPITSLEEARDVIVDLIRSKEPEFTFNKHVILHDHPDLNRLQLWKRFNRESITVHSSFADDPDVLEKTTASFIGITAADIGVADSATLIQLTTPGRPRCSSLIPSIHIGLIRREKIVANLEEAYTLLSQLKLPDSFVFITGPSKTADIEAQLVHGAHGPKELHLLLLNEQEQSLESPETATDEEQGE